MPSVWLSGHCGAVVCRRTCTQYQALKSVQNHTQPLSTISAKQDGMFDSGTYISRSKDGLASLCDLAVKAHYIALVPFCQSGIPASDTCSYQTYYLDSVIVTCILNHIPTPFAQSKHSAQSPYQCKVMANHFSIGCIPVHTCPAVTYMRVSR